MFFDKKEKLAVYAAQVTGNPHFFDSNTTAEIFLFDFISYHFHTQNGEGLSDMEYRNQQYYTAGIIRDDLSNYVTVYGIHAKDTDSILHSGIEGFFDRKEPILLTLYTLSEVERGLWRERNLYSGEPIRLFLALPAISREKFCLHQWTVKILGFCIIRSFIQNIGPVLFW